MVWLIWVVPHNVTIASFPAGPRPTFRHLQYRKVGNGGREDLIRLGRSLIVPMPEVAQLTAHLQASISTLPTSVAAVVRHDSQGAKVSLPRHLGVFWQVCGPTACNWDAASQSHSLGTNPSTSLMITSHFTTLYKPTMVYHPGQMSKLMSKLIAISRYAK